MIEVKNISKSYNTKNGEVKALSQIDLKINTSEFVLVKGESGCGKTTLLFSLGGMQQPTSGEVIVNDKNLYSLSEKERIKYRANEIGFVFQSYNLIPVLSARENVEFIMQLQGVGAADRRTRAINLLESLGLEGMIDRRPGEMSGGQQQRVAVARAIVTHPVLLLADEPSANLDSSTTEELLKLLRSLNDEQGVTIVTATHDPLVMSYAKRQVKLRDGQIIEDSTRQAA